MVNYEIIKYISEFERPHGESIQLNLMKWANNPERYDLRKWDSDGNPQKGITVTKEELYQIYLDLKELFESNSKISKVVVEQDEDWPFDGPSIFSSSSNSIVKTKEDDLFNSMSMKKQPVELPFSLEEIETIEYSDYLIHTNNFTKEHEGHSYKEVKAIITYMDKVCAIRKCIIKAFYCYDCKKYYISEYLYNNITEDKTILASVFSEKEYKDFEYSQEFLREKSIMRAMGYNTDLTDGQRQTILDYMIDNKARTLGQIKYHLDFLIEEGKRTKKIRAVEKWEKDLEYLKIKRWES